MYLNNLTTNTVYDLKIQAATRSQVGEKVMHFGEFSDTRRILLQPGCEAMRTFSPRATEKDSILLINLEEHFGTIAGVVCGTLGLLLAIFVFLILRLVSKLNFCCVSLFHFLKRKVPSIFESCNTPPIIQMRGRAQLPSASQNMNS